MSVADLDIHGPRMKCLDPEEFENINLFGTYNTGQASHLLVVLEKCDPEKKEIECKDEDVINEWLQFKYLVTLENSRRFITHQFEDDRIESRSTIHMYPVSADIRFEVVKEIQRNKIELSDYKVNIGEILKDIELGYNSEVVQSRTIPYENKMWNSIVFEMSLNRIHQHRYVYSFLDVLRDVGGLFSSLSPICGIVIAIFQYRGSYMFIASQMLSEKI